MTSAKDLVVKPILAKDARALIKRLHYSGKVVNNSVLNFGVFLNNRLEGVLQFGSPINKKGTIKLVKNTQWNSILELNRMAFSDRLPKNSESRAISVSLKIIKKKYPHIDWVLSFADATQCGDGAIYRASGFVLTDIRVNTALRISPKGEQVHIIQAHHLKIPWKEFKTWQLLKGYQLRYIYFVKKELIKNLVVPIIPFSKISEMNIGMYKGKLKNTH